MQINLTSATISTYRDLMKTIQQVLYASWGKDKVRLTSAYPKKTEGDNIIPPIITYSIVRKIPGVLKGSSEIKPRQREVINIQDEQGHTVPLELLGHLFDYTILFEVWEGDGDAADELAERFQHFMTQYTGYFKKAGVNEMIFDRMDSTLGTPEWRSDLVKRNIVYFVRLDEITGATCPVIEDITVDALVHQTTFQMVLDILTRDDGQ